MNFEINMINVEDGDSIILQLEKKGRQALIVIDGGYRRFYEKLERRIKLLLPNYNNKIDLIVCSHYDNDHLEGISLLLDYCHSNDIEIGEIWMHKIENKLAELIAAIDTEEKLLQEKKRFKELSEYKSKVFFNEQVFNKEENLMIESYQFLKELLQKIINFGLEKKVKEVVKGDFLDGFEEFKVVSPTTDFYNSYLPTLKKEKFLGDIQKTSELRMLSESNRPTDSRTIEEMVGDVINPCSRLETSSIANSVTSTNLVSIVTLLSVDDSRLLFAADAGIESFQDQQLLTSELKDLDWLQLPHHGSKNNTSLTMLDHFNPKIVFVSGKNIENRPSAKVVNCLKEKSRFQEIHVTNEETDTWYLKIKNDLQTERIMWAD